MSHSENDRISTPLGGFHDRGESGEFGEPGPCIPLPDWDAVDPAVIAAIDAAFDQPVMLRHRERPRHHPADPDGTSW